jgi:hypothetical protein
LFPLLERAHRVPQSPLALGGDQPKRRQRSRLAGDASPNGKRFSFQTPKKVHLRREVFQRVAREPSPLRDDNRRQALPVSATRVLFQSVSFFFSLS